MPLEIIILILIVVFQAFAYVFLLSFKILDLTTVTSYLKSEFLNVRLSLTLKLLTWHLLFWWLNTWSFISILIITFPISIQIMIFFTYRPRFLYYFFTLIINMYHNVVLALFWLWSIQLLLFPFEIFFVMWMVLNFSHMLLRRSFFC